MSKIDLQRRPTKLMPGGWRLVEPPVDFPYKCISFWALVQLFFPGVCTVTRKKKLNMVIFLDFPYKFYCFLGINFDHILRPLPNKSICFWPSAWLRPFWVAWPIGRVSGKSGAELVWWCLSWICLVELYVHISTSYAHIGPISARFWHHTGTEPNLQHV